MVNAPVIARPSPHRFTSFNRAQFSTKANSSISMNVSSCVTCIFFFFVFGFLSMTLSFIWQFLDSEDYVHYLH